MTLGARRFDVIVLGAGPAGASAAFTAAKAGLKVALVDKTAFPRAKLCGGALTGRAIGHHQTIFGGLPDAAYLTKTDISFHAYGDDLGINRDVPPLHLTMRWDFDATLVAKAIDAGAEDFTGHTGTLDPSELTFSVSGQILAATVIIAADGVNSPTARHLFGTAFDKSQIGFALEVEDPEVSDNTPLRIDFGAADWGYGWQFPKKTGTTIGIGGVLSRNADMKTSLAAYLARLNRAPNSPVKGQFLPFGSFRAIPGQGRILLAGDAAGLVDPITGEGIGHAMHSGALAAKATIEAISQGKPDSALGRYTTNLAPIHQSLRHARRLRHLMFRETLRPAFLRSFRHSRTLRTEYLRLLAGETEYGPLMRQMSARLPAFLWRAIRGI